ncbi:D-2-hydroxyacid dehydrogenase [Clostridium massiliamazoniense]|uniref:D-2-hydroxyacid dehydrogenase n=1 Tax=Clostridium massiliamazoniense TaxID=1347366 RepID=UPI0006D842B7|nr:D-2-hydroxyacid dehydrogenase [Clostridium massiliamazoniense]
MIKVLINDGLEKNAVEELKKFDIEIINEHFEGEELENKIKEVNAIIVRSATKVRKDLIDKAKETGNLKLIVRGGVGVDNIDVDYAIKKGIEVKNTPAASSDSVAELALGQMFVLARFINQANLTMKNGQWNKKKYTGIELTGKKIGIIGMGRIGRALGKRCYALGMKVGYFDSLGKIDGLLDYEALTLDELLKTSDFISIHIPSTEVLIGRNEIEKMKDGVFIVNTARGTVIDSEALLDALDSGKIGGAALDVFVNEPKPDERLVNHEKISPTPHIGASTKEAQERIGDEIVSIVKECFNLEYKEAVL